MTNKELHPSIQKFKSFVKDHPKMVMEVRKGNSTFQELFEEWYLLGEEDPRWEAFKDGNEEEKSSSEEEEKKEWIPQILGAIKNMDPNQIQGHISNLSQALGAIQGVISQFQTGNQPNFRSGSGQGQSSHPFHFRKD